MSIDCHIKIDGIKGESQHDKHKDEIDVLAWTWHANNPTTILTGGGGGGGKAMPGELVFAHYYDSASPLLAQKCLNGSHLDTVKVSARKSGGEQQEFLTITMKQVLISNVQQSANTGGDITEHVSLAYADIEFEYKAQGKDGSLGSGIKMGFDVKAVKAR